MGKANNMPGSGQPGKREKMAHFTFDAVVKIGSMALIRKEDNDLDYNVISRLAHDLRPGYILVSSDASWLGLTSTEQ